MNSPFPFGGLILMLLYLPSNHLYSLYKDNFLLLYATFQDPPSIIFIFVSESIIEFTLFTSSTSTIYLPKLCKTILHNFLHLFSQTIYNINLLVGFKITVRVISPVIFSSNITRGTSLMMPLSSKSLRPIKCP